MAKMSCEEARKKYDDVCLPLKYDVIVPCHFVDWTYFSSNVKAWFREIPIRRLLFGCNNPDEEYRATLRSFFSAYDNVEFIDQCGFKRRGMQLTEIKTLGMQLADLMKRVETPWFVYFHTDACPTRHSFLVMRAEVDEKVGIVESERVSYEYDKKTDFPTVYPHYHYRPRSFSGYQLIRKQAIESILDKIEDDYIYRNEDIIFQNVCENNGFNYVKSWAMHVHTNSKINQIWTPQGIESKNARLETYDMQIKGIVKYCTPNEITLKAFQAAFGICYRENNLDLFEFIEGFVKENNPQWEKPLKKMINDLLGAIYK